MQIRSRELHQLKTSRLFLKRQHIFVCSHFFTGFIMLRPFHIAFLCLAFFYIFKIEGVKKGYNCLGGLGLVEKPVYFLT